MARCVMSAAGPGREPGAGDHRERSTVQAALMTTFAGRHLPLQLALACSSFSSHVCVLETGDAFRKCEESSRAIQGKLVNSAPVKDPEGPGSKLANCMNANEARMVASHRSRLV